MAVFILIYNLLRLNNFYYLEEKFTVSNSIRLMGANIPLNLKNTIETLWIYALYKLDERCPKLGAFSLHRLRKSDLCPTVTRCSSSKRYSFGDDQLELIISHFELQQTPSSIKMKKLARNRDYASNHKKEAH